MQHAVERIQGFEDVVGTAYCRAAAMVHTLLEGFRLAGYQTIDVPVVEPLELYLRKNGAQVLPMVYAFVDQGKHEVALRPEFTASVIRAIGPTWSVATGPLRLSYAGPVFRYEQPALDHGRQFTQVGIELLGDSGAAADAEVLALACHVARTLGARRLRLVLGHLGPLRSLLSFLDVDGYAEQFLLDHLEFFNRGVEQQRAVRDRLGLGAGDVGPSLEADESLAQSLANAVRDLDQREARRLVASMLDQLGLTLAGSTREPEEIIDRVLVKAKRRAARLDGTWRERLERALGFVERLGTLCGEPMSIMAATQQLLAEYGVPVSALEELKAVLTLLGGYDMHDISIELAPGMARGIAYYSGLIFELYADTDDGRSLHICGGGRYDALSQALTGTPCAALGFAFNLHYLLQTVQHEPTHSMRRQGIVIRPERGERWAEAQGLAQRLRDAGLVCVVQHETQNQRQHETVASAVEVVLYSGSDGAEVLVPGGEEVAAVASAVEQIVFGAAGLRRTHHPALTKTERAER